MVYGFDGLWSRVRPRLVVREPIPSWPEGTLRNAIERIPDDERMEALTAALSSMAIAPEHPEWELVHQLVKRTTDLPPAAFSVLRILPRVPDVWPDLCALLLLQSLFRDQEAPRLTVEAMEALPFSYASLPVGAIERATERMMRWLTEQLGAPDTALERLEERLDALPTPWMVGPIRRTAYAVVGRVPTDAPAAIANRAWPTKAWQAAFALANTMPSSVPLRDTALRYAVQDQLAAVRRQLLESGLPNEVLRIRELALAPLAGALAACYDIQLSPTAQFQLRRILRRFGEPAQAALRAAYDYGLANRWSTPAPQTAPHA
jgi:hypothetical protein